MKRILNRKFVIISGLIVTLGVFFYSQNNFITVSQYEIYSEKLPESFNEFRILQISDLHNKEFGSDQKQLVSKINNALPDIIVITGDFIDSRRYNEEPSLKLIRELIKLYPIYYVNGNHESRRSEYPEFEEKLVSMGVNVLSNQSEFITKDNGKILITGIDDPCFTECDYNGMPDDYLVDENNHFSILLSHRPELFDSYASNNVDLVFSGHAHGGQIRIPFIGGIVAPEQGLFPEYTEGVHKIDDSCLVISRGLGNSLFPLRVFNRPELVVVTLYSE